jgi:hypothetical protein
MINNLVSAQYSLSALVPRLSSAPASTQPPAGIMSILEAVAQRNTASSSDIESAYGLPPSDSAALLRAQLFPLDAQLRAPLTSINPVAKTYTAVQNSTATTVPRLSELA